MSKYNAFVTLLLLLLSFWQYHVKNDWQAALFVLVAAGFYALYHKSAPDGQFVNCQVFFNGEAKAPEVTDNDNTNGK